MSIFPKRALQGDSITIHWNFNTSKLRGTHRFPLVRIGVKDPNGKVTMLFERHVLALPAVADEEKAVAENQLLYLNKNVPLLMVASYLSGRYSKEKLVDILENIQGGRHYYFSYPVPKDGPLGKYSLISEVISEGQIQHSNTADDDFFYVEKIGVSEQLMMADKGKATLTNFSSEPVPVKIIEYHRERNLRPSDVRVFELPGSVQQEITFNSPYTYLSYNEEREMLPMAFSSAVVSRNPYFLSLEKKEENSTYIFSRDKQDGYVLESEHQQIWRKANGLNHKNDFVHAGNQDVYQEMLKEQLIRELTGHEHH